MLQQDPSTDWMYTADAGGCGLGLADGRMMVPRGKMLGGSSGINYMAYVRGHPGDFDAWAADGATGWSYDEVLPYFTKSEGLAPSGDIVIDADAHNTTGALGVSVRAPVLPAAQQFVDAAVAAGIPRGDYNGRDRGGPDGVVSLLQTTTRDGKRASTYHAFLEGDAEQRPNLEVICHAHVTRVLLDQDGDALRATGVEFRHADGATQVVRADREVILSGGAVGSPHVLMLSGIGPRAELEAVGVTCLLDAPDVGKHLKDHLQVGLFFPAPGVGVSMNDVGVSMGPDALRAPNGPLPADPADDAALPPELAGAQGRRRAAGHRVGHHRPRPGLVVAVRRGGVVLHRPRRRPHPRRPARRVRHRLQPRHLAALPARRPRRVLRRRRRRAGARRGEHLRARQPGAAAQRGRDPHHEPGSARPPRHPDELLRRSARPRRDGRGAAARRSRSPSTGRASSAPWSCRSRSRPSTATSPGDRPSDALLADLARHYSFTVYHLTSTCRIGSVVDAQLRVLGVRGLRVADASVMPNVVSGNTNAACIMIGEKAAEMLAAEHGVQLAERVG